MYLDRNLGLRLSLSEITLLFDLSLYLDRTLAQQKAKSKVKVSHFNLTHGICQHVQHSNCQGKLQPDNFNYHIFNMNKISLYE